MEACYKFRILIKILLLSPGLGFELALLEAHALSAFFCALFEFFVSQWLVVIHLVFFLFTYIVPHIRRLDTNLISARRVPGPWQHKVRAALLTLNQGIRLQNLRRPLLNKPQILLEITVRNPSPNEFMSEIPITLQRVEHQIH